MSNWKSEVVGKLFFESVGVDDAILSVSNSGNILKMRTILQDADSPNRNGRVYPKSVIVNALKHPYIAEKLDTNSLAGEMNHPEPGSSLQRQMTIDMRNISHFIRKIYWDDKNPKLLIGDIETSANSVGRDFKDMILENNMQCSFSMRGGGDTITKGGLEYVKDPLRILTYDAVQYPSHKCAYMLSKLSEDKTLDVTMGMMAEYLSKNSENFSVICESINCFSMDAYNLSLSEGKIVIAEKKTGKEIGYSILEQKLAKEYKDMLKSI
jgi:hypothetical protein